MTRRSLLKLLTWLPLVGPPVAKALAVSTVSLTKSKPPYAPYLPSFFPKWDSTIDGLQDGLQWAQAVERTRLPSDLRFPKTGEIWQTLCDCQVEFRVRINIRWAPEAQKLLNEFRSMLLYASEGRLILGGNALLPRGEKICVLPADNSRPLHVTFRPVHYQDLEKRIVPEKLRESPGYQGFELSAKIARTIPEAGPKHVQSFFNDAFTLVPAE